MQFFVFLRRYLPALLFLWPYATFGESINWEGAKKSLFDAKYEIGAVTGGITYLGVKEWNWGSASFKFNEEGWFGMDTGSGGMDKLGHMYSSYLIAEAIGNGLSKENDADFAATYSALWASSLMLYVEIFDGYSEDHGFSYEDVIFNSTGIAFSYLRTRNPQLKELLDYRLDYRPSKGMKGFHPVTDYSGMRYLLALKAAGIPGLRNTPLKYLELNLGYMARGFKATDAPFFPERSSEVFVGLSFNLDELLFKPYSESLGSFGKYASTVSHYYQPRGSYIKTTLDKRNHCVSAACAR
ncbi:MULTISPECIES: DUF2279 domain-containing protein [Microbulbifer]|uniref:DUF2279 domain-containing protein n=1 Tax=Microbulbifer celer TaxID=435905 RepID=A0ABW3U5M6_9GAMM|nr:MULTISPECIES: DUF2279 domain-containing protein [Microbulbifer]UFN58335.1 YfiM family protein [Microbulbifer celer]